jgi:hypothetical protein
MAKFLEKRRMPQNVMDAIGKQLNDIDEMWLSIYEKCKPYDEEA